MVYVFWGEGGVAQVVLIANRLIVLINNIVGFNQNSGYTIRRLIVFQLRFCNRIAVHHVFGMGEAEKEKKYKKTQSLHNLRTAKEGESFSMYNFTRREMSSQ